LSFYRIMTVRKSTEIYMTAKSETADDLLAALAWQQQMGIDETLVDDPVSAATVTLRDISAPRPSPALKPVTSADSLPVSGTVTPQEETPPPSSGTGQFTEIASIAALKAALQDFDQCALKHTASNMVFSDGNEGARLMVISDVPGREEDRIGLPLVGAAGQLFDHMLASIGLTRADVYITSLLPWRPPGNRTPTSEEMALLLPWLYRHIQLAAPEYVLILGGAPAQALVPGAGSILKIRGKWTEIEFGDGIERQVIASLHPEYLLRSPAQKRLAWTDLLALADKLL